SLQPLRERPLERANRRLLDLLRAPDEAATLDDGRRAENAPHRHLPQRHDRHVRRDGLELLSEPPRATRGSTRLVLFWPATQDGVRDPRLAPVDLRLLKHLVEELTTRSNERLAVNHFHPAWRLADEHQPNLLLRRRGRNERVLVLIRTRVAKRTFGSCVVVGHKPKLRHRLTLVASVTVSRVRRWRTVRPETQDALERFFVVLVVLRRERGEDRAVVIARHDDARTLVRRPQCIPELHAGAEARFDPRAGHAKPEDVSGNGAPQVVVGELRPLVTRAADGVRAGELAEHRTPIVRDGVPGVDETTLRTLDEVHFLTRTGDINPHGFFLLSVQ